jgi:hypothetical protein
VHCSSDTIVPTRRRSAWDERVPVDFGVMLSFRLTHSYRKPAAPNGFINELILALNCLSAGASWLRCRTMTPTPLAVPMNGGVVDRIAPLLPLPACEQRAESPRR